MDKMGMRAVTGNLTPADSGDEHICFAVWKVQQWASCSAVMFPLKANPLVNQDQPGGCASVLLCRCFTPNVTYYLQL